MPNITIRDVPPEVHEVLARRAAQRGQSLQQYLVSVLTQITAQPTMGEWLEELSEMHATWDPTIDRSFDTVTHLQESHRERDARIAGL